jgi:hypothetical protein
MTPDAAIDHPDRLRPGLRRRALANLVLVLLEEARRGGGRLGVEPLGRDAVLLLYRDVRTLVRCGEIFTFAERDFAVALLCPPQWPFERSAALQPIILSPPDFAHPNASGGICVDLEGITPERLPALLYDNICLRRFRLDHCLDSAAAAFVRAHLAEFPADPRPLSAPRPNCGDPPMASSQAPRCGIDAGEDQENGLNRPLLADGLFPPGAAAAPIVDLVVGAFAARVPPLLGPTFLRLERPATPLIDRARATYVRAANAHLRCGRGLWLDGAGLAVDPATTDPTLLALELLALARALAALGDAAIAQSYLEMCGGD